MRRTPHIARTPLLLPALLFLSTALALATPLPDTAASLEYFEANIRPLLVDHCYSCHSAEADKIKGDLRLDVRAGWERGGSSGKPAIIPGHPDASPLIQAVRHTHEDLAMPPKKKLADDQIAKLEIWIRMGAPDPRTGGAKLPDPAEAARQHWAFQPISEPPPPRVRDESWIANGVDRFVLASLESKGLQPSPRADARTLVRRAAAVLTGLPPTAEEVSAFETNPSPEAFARLIDRWLASPRYGERWARHWLDVARYADTKGYVFEEERRYPYAYTYRDYVIRAFNDDKPYDQFLIEQIAADQVVDGDDRSALAAMGFLTLGRRFLNNPHDIIDDRIDVLTRGTMALTVTCARCHDHKYDPVPAADYYSLYGVFASSHEPSEKPLLGTIPDRIRYEEFQRELARREKERDDFVRSKVEAHRLKLRRTIGDHLLAAFDAAKLADAGKREELARSRQLSPNVVGKWVGALEKTNLLPAPLFSAWHDFAALKEEDFPSQAGTLAQAVAANTDGSRDAAVSKAFSGAAPASLKDVADRYNRLFAEALETSQGSARAFLDAQGTPIDLSPEEIYRLFDVPEGQRKRALQRAVEELQATHPGAPPRAMALADNTQPVEPVVFKRGNPGNRGAQVPRQFLGMLSGPDRKPFAQGSGRLELARAIASPANPLTARVAVNRVWLQHFGAGLVRTPGDFGLRSEPPTHPELLDWLASQFISSGWSVKSLHRLILLSATWQQASDLRPELETQDPDNRLLARQSRRRLDFESARDTLLQAGTGLDLTMGGHSVEITTRDYMPRRTVYGFVERQNLPGIFRTFDFATPDTSSAQRFQTTVPQQALFFMNSPFAIDQARRLARRPELTRIADPATRVTRLYEIVLQRTPEPDEIALAQRFLERQNQRNEEPAEPPVWQYGFGQLDPTSQRVLDFRPLPHFTANTWQGGPQLPDPTLGWILLNAEGGHPGGRQHGPAIRRWTARQDGTVAVAGTLRHSGDAGDGVQGSIVSSRHGVLGQWQVTKTSADTTLPRIDVTRGDTLDFVVECRVDENSDGFRWAPRVTLVASPDGAGVGQVSDAKAEFSGPQPAVVRLDTWERFAQVLLMANETVFID
ncbi:MAG: PSD1 domain-containing protein [Verrucomicrobiales bacterium]|nr:PSD1 domain-containing protein [Verrucomicrobiales bacterium]